MPEVSEARSTRAQCLADADARHRSVEQHAVLATRSRPQLRADRAAALDRADEEGRADKYVGRAHPLVCSAAAQNLAVAQVARVRCSGVDFVGDTVRSDTKETDPRLSELSYRL